MTKYGTYIITKFITTKYDEICLEGLKTWTYYLNTSFNKTLYRFDNR